MVKSHIHLKWIWNQVHTFQQYTLCMFLHLFLASAVRQSTGGSNFSPLDLDCNLLAIKRITRYVSLVGQNNKKKQQPVVTTKTYTNVAIVAIV